MFERHGNMIETDVLIIGAGGGGMITALNAKRSGPPGTRVAIVDSWTVGRCGQTAFSNAWSVVVAPEDDLEAIQTEIIQGCDGIADQHLIHEVLASSYEQLKDLEDIGLHYPKDGNDNYLRKPTRGLDHARVMSPKGGGLEFSWRLRRALEEAGVMILDRIFITGLMRGGGDGIVGAVGVHSRSGEFHVLKARSTVVATNAITFRSGFVRDLTGTGTLLAYRAGAALRDAEFSYLRPTTPKFYFEGITFAIQEGAKFVNRDDQKFMQSYEPVRGDQADVHRQAYAMAMERKAGRDPLFLDMRAIPEKKRNYFINSNVAWMKSFFTKLVDEAKTDMFGKTPYFPSNQMTKMSVRTDADCRSDVPGLLAAGLAQAGCANHFAGFSIAMCIGTGRIAGRSAIRELDVRPEPILDSAEIESLRKETFAPLEEKVTAKSDELLHTLQTIMFDYSVSIWKHADRLTEALAGVEKLGEEFKSLNAPHTHELVRLKETEAMILAAEIILRTSLMRTETRLSHFREDYEERDDDHWLSWIDVTEKSGEPDLSKTPIPTPLVSIGRAA